MIAFWGVYCSVLKLLEGGGEKGIFVNGLRVGEDWVSPPYLEELTQDLLE